MLRNAGKESLCKICKWKCYSRPRTWVHVTTCWAIWVEKKMSLPLDPTYCCHCHDQPHNDCLDNTCAEFQFCKWESSSFYLDWFIFSLLIHCTWTSLWNSLIEMNFIVLQIHVSSLILNISITHFIPLVCKRLVFWCF